MQVLQILEDIKEHATYSPVTLIAVSKKVAVDKVKEAYEAGVRDFGESRLKEGIDKMEQMPEDVIWHYIGPIQSNKARKIAKHFDWIHSIASLKVAKIISNTCLEMGKKIPCFIEVNVIKDPAKEGFLEKELKEALLELKTLAGLDIKGLMMMGPHIEDEKQIREAFKKAKALQKQYGYLLLSMGMSQDYILALEEGATHIRVGSYLFS